MILIIIGLVIYSSLVIYRPHWGIYLTLLLLPSYQIRFDIFGIPTTFLEWLILILAGVTLAKIFIDKNFRDIVRERLGLLWKQNKNLLMLAALFFLAATISVFVSPEFGRGLGLWKAYFAEAMLFGLLFYLLVDSKEKLAGVFSSMGWLVIGLTLFGLFQFFTLYRLPPAWWGPGLEPRRVVSLFTYPNAVSLLITPILAVFAAMLALREKLPIQFISRTFIIVTLALGMVLLVLTFSRGAWVGFACTIILVALFTSKRKLVISLLVAGTILILIIPATRGRLLPIFIGSDPAGQERILLYKGAWEIIKDSPITGAGLYGFRGAYEQVRQSEGDEILNYPHNFFLNFWVETGLLGLLSILLILALLTKRGVVLYRQSREAQAIILAVFAGLVVILVHGQFDAPYFKNDLAVLFWTIIAIIPVFATLPAVKQT